MSWVLHALVPATDMAWRSFVSIKQWIVVLQASWPLSRWRHQMMRRWQIKVVWLPEQRRGTDQTAYGSRDCQSMKPTHPSACVFAKRPGSNVWHGLNTMEEVGLQFERHNEEIKSTKQIFSRCLGRNLLYYLICLNLMRLRIQSVPVSKIWKVKLMKTIFFYKPPVHHLLNTF